MEHQLSKTKKYIVSLLTTLFLIVVSSFRPAYALTVSCDLTTEDERHFVQILCVVARALNVVLLVSGSVFVLVIIFTAYKFAIAQGDPKALQASKDSLTVAVAGFILILFFFALLYITGRLFGLGSITPMGAINTLEIRIQDLLDIARIERP